MRRTLSAALVIAWLSAPRPATLAMYLAAQDRRQGSKVRTQLISLETTQILRPQTMRPPAKIAKIATESPVPSAARTMSTQPCA